MEGEGEKSTIFRPKSWAIRKLIGLKIDKIHPACSHLFDTKFKSTETCCSRARVRHLPLWPQLWCTTAVYGAWNMWPHVAICVPPPVQSCWMTPLIVFALYLNRSPGNNEWKWLTLSWDTCNQHAAAHLIPLSLYLIAKVWVSSSSRLSNPFDCLNSYSLRPIQLHSKRDESRQVVRSLHRDRALLSGQVFH